MAKQISEQIEADKMMPFASLQSHLRGLNQYGRKMKSFVVYSIVLAIVIPQLGSAHSPAKIPYSKYFVEAKAVQILQCIGAKPVANKQHKGVTTTTNEGVFLLLANLKGAETEKEISFSFNQFRISDPEEFSKLDHELQMSLTLALFTETIYKPGETYLVFFLGNKEIKGFLLPTYPTPSPPDNGPSKKPSQDAVGK